MKKIYSIRGWLIHKRFTDKLTLLDPFKLFVLEFILFVYEYFKYNGMLRRLDKQAKNQEKLAKELEELFVKDLEHNKYFSAEEFDIVKRKNR